MKHPQFRFSVGIAALFLIISPLRADPVEWTIASGGNGHFYEAFSVSSGISWDSAEADALARGGYLATILSSAENTFVFNLVDNPIYWFTNPANQNSGPWLGGFQPSGSPEPDGGWTWLNGDGAFAYTNWSPGEPNNAGGGENWLEFYGASGPTARSSLWADNDQNPDPNDRIVGYVVEYNAVPEPSSVALALSAAAIALAIKLVRTTRPRRQY